jgi:hypothetical protein
MVRPKSRGIDARILLLSSDKRYEWNIFHTLRNLREVTDVKFDQYILPKKSRDILEKKYRKDEHLTSNADHLYRNLLPLSGRGGMAPSGDQKPLTRVAIFDEYIFFCAHYAKRNKSETHDSSLMRYVQFSNLICFRYISGITVACLFIYVYHLLKVPRPSELFEVRCVSQTCVGHNL